MAKFSDYLKNIFFLLLIIQFAPPILKGLKKQYLQLVEAHYRVACITINETICHSAYYAKYLRTYFTDRSIKALLLKIDCPGGAAGACESIAHEISLLKKLYPKPIVTLTENICASGGYYIAATSDYIFASPSTLLGSIGAIIPNQFRLREFLAQYHVTYETIKAGRYKAATDMFAEQTPDQKELLEKIVQSSYDNFVQHIASQRHGLSIANKELWADGKIFTGNQALKLGLIDAIGSWSDAVAKIKALTGMKDDEKIDWLLPTKNASWWNMFKQDEFEGQDPQQDVPFAHQLITTFLNILESRYGSQQSPIR